MSKEAKESAESSAPTCQHQNQAVKPLPHSTLSKKQRLLLSFVDDAPFSIWACNRNFEIVLWNRQAEKIYGYSESEALGKNFIELFVDEPEQDQAAKDCLAIIDNGAVFKNFLAYDKKRGGNQLTMLTNCFRIWDEDAKEHLQAEVGLEVSDLGESAEKHRNLREMGMALMATKKKTAEIRRAELRAKLATAQFDCQSRLASARMEGERWLSMFVAQAGDVRLYEDLERIVRDKSEARIFELKQECDRLLTEISSIKEPAEADIVEAQIESLSRR